MAIKIFGIKNCDTVRKARRWLMDNEIPFDFIDIRVNPLSNKEWQSIVAKTDSSVLVNTRGTSWRKLDESVKDITSDEKVVKLLSKHPTIMKRPLLISGKIHHIGFKPEQYAELLK
jgi:Spx/MgsR family transcriptional regulator